jgi:major membrane immunogen (membrane-anchored lipoprotein)
MITRARTLTLVVASALVLVGCGSGSDSDDGIADLSATKILAKAEKQLAQEDFIAVKGQGKDEDEGAEIAVDMSFAGKTASGTVEFSGMTLKVLKADGKSYFKADKEFFESSGAPAETMDLIGDKWVAIDPGNQNFAEIGSFVSKKEFFDSLLDPESKVTKGKEKKVNGVDCIALKDKQGTFYFDKSNARPISLVATSGAGSFDFSYEKVSEAEAPPADEVLDLANLPS